MKADILNRIEGYSEITRELEELRKHAVGHSAEKTGTSEIVGELHPPSLKLQLSEAFDETDSTRTLRLVSLSGYLPPFQAGQYINVFVDIDGIKTSRPYSISSAPNQIGCYDITVRRINDGFVSNYLLDELAVGDEIETTSPTGQFHHNPLFHGEDLVYIAGGSGITPFMSMIREMTDRNLSRQVHLIYGSRIKSDIVFGDELTERSSRHHNLTFTPVISEPDDAYLGETGFITADMIKKLVGNGHDKMFYVCGPEAMYTFVLAELESLGIPKRKIRVEVFGPPADVTRQPGWDSGIHADDTFSVVFSGQSPITAKAGEPLMNSLERNGYGLEASCRSGECSLCRTKLVSGKVFHPASVKIRKSDRKYGYIHPCMAYPLSDLELIL